MSYIILAVAVGLVSYWYYSKRLAKNDEEWEQFLILCRERSKFDKEETKAIHERFLNELSEVTGIDVIELPSFGTVTLNTKKETRK